MAADEDRFSSTDVTWIGDPDQAASRLADDDVHPLGFISDASNGTMLCRIGDPADKVYAIYKPAQFERPLWDFPDGLYLREVAAFEVSRFLGWDLVPPTVLRDGPQGPGSLQLFVPHAPAEHYFELIQADRWLSPLAKVAMFDFLTNNADRKGGHVLRHLGQDRLYAIDNGLTFHVEHKLRTVIWDVAEVRFENPWTDDVLRLAAALTTDEDLHARLRPLLNADELTVLGARALRVARMTGVPEVHPDARHYPWPPI